MPPKSNKGGGGGPAKKTANGRAWNDSSKQTLLTQISEYIPEDMCWRCSGYGHKLLECSDKKSAKYWAIGEGKFEDKRAVEKFFQDHRDSLIENKTFVPKQKPTAPAPSDKLINMGVLAKEMKNTPASGSPKKAVKQRTPIYTEGVGESIYVQDQTVADNPLAVPRNSVPDVATTLVGPEAKENELSIIANYVKVQEVPAKLHVYSLTFSRPSLDPQKPTARIELNRRREIKIIFDALMDVDAFGLNGNTQSWATDYKDLWCAKPLDSPYEDKQWDTEVCTCKLLDGKSYDGVYATVNYMGVLADIAEKLKKGDIRQVSDHIRALNAHNARCIARNDNLADPAVTQLGAKKSYLNKAFTPMKGYGDQASVLRAVLGYYTSIRPGAYGPILNVNVATTAFIAPMRVSQLLSAVGDSQFDYAERMLRGARVRLTNKRQEFAETKEQEYSMNDELSRTKVFQQFGEVASLQTFHTVLENSNKTGRSVAPGDAGTTVLKYFKDMGVSFPNDNESTQLCVNVGKRVRSFQLGTSTPSDMQKQTVDGAQWIPAYLLEIFPFQPMGGLMSPDHTTEMMKVALHLPAENAALIDQEGLEMLDVRSQSQGHVSLQNLGFKLDTNLISLAAKSIQMPTLLYEKRDVETTIPHTKNDDRAKKTEVTISPDKASWNLQDVAFPSPATMNQLNVFAFPETVIRTGTLRAHHINVNTPDYAAPGGHWNYHRLQPELQAWWAASQVKDCTLFILSRKNFQRYPAIKRSADFAGYHSLCAVGSKIARDDGRNDKTGSRWQHFSNLALKLNMKMGGDNHWLEPNALNKAFGSQEGKRSTMVMGSDVTHPGAGTKVGNPSIACVVGTVDDRFKSYRGSMRLQADGQEQIDEMNLQSMIVERLQDWKANNEQELPKRILFYRDGVSESQFATIERTEITEIRKAYIEAGGDAEQLTLAFIVVDDVVTAPKPFNFFLQSHAAIKGTARSAHYYVLENDTDIDRAELQSITMMLCYTFGRSTTGVSYAAPAYIAGRLCERGRAYIRTWAEDKFAEPVFEYTEYKDSHGKVRKPTDEERLEEKRGMVSAILDFEMTKSKDAPVSERKIWGNYKAGARLNPWHSNLDQGMFWI